MPKIEVDFSIFMPGAFGYATGPVSLSGNPKVGDVVDIFEATSARLAIGSFSGLLRVEGVVEQDDSSITLMLEDVFLHARSEALAVKDLVERELDLLVIVYDDDLSQQP